MCQCNSKSQAKLFVKYITYRMKNEVDVEQQRREKEWEIGESLKTIC